MKLFTLIVFFFSFTAQSQKTDLGTTVPVSREYSKHQNQGEVVSCQIVKKVYETKGGKITEHSDYYLRCSIDDYFIKICESNVTQELLERNVNNGFNMLVEFKDGLWDQCTEEMVQSRTGPYVIILKVLK